MKSCHWMVRSAVKKSPQKKSRIVDDAYNLKKLLGNASLTGIFCLYKIAIYTSVSSSAHVLFFSLLLNTLCRQARRQPVRQRKWSIPVVHILSEKFCFSAVFGLHCCGCCFWIAGIPLLTYFLFFFCGHLLFLFYFFPFLQIDRSCMMPFCSQGARDPECAAWLGKRAPSKWESTPRQRGKNANRGGAARSSMFTGFDFWKKIAPMYLPSSYMCPGQRRNVCADLSIHADATGERDSEACSDGVRHRHGSGKHIQRMTRRVSCTCSVARGSAKPRVRWAASAICERLAHPIPRFRFRTAAILRRCFCASVFLPFPLPSRHLIIPYIATTRLG